MTNRFDPLTLLLGPDPVGFVPEVFGVEVPPTPCRKCGGSGRINSYRHVQGGVCFRCDGMGIEGTQVG